MKKRGIPTIRKATAMVRATLDRLFVVANRAFKKTRMFYLEIMYKIHLRIRYLHDLTYGRSKLYKKWTDKPYSSNIHKASLWAFILSFVILQGIQQFFPYFSIWKPQTAQAGSSTATWTTSAHFTNNGATNGNYTGATTVANVNTTNDQAKLIAHGSLAPLSFDLGAAPIGQPAVNAVTNKIYTASYGGSNVKVVDGATNTVTATVALGGAGGGVAVNSATNKIYALNYTGNSVKVIDGVTNTVTATITVGAGPSGIAVNSVTNKIYVNNGTANTVSVINGATDAVTTTITNPTTGGRSVAVNTATNKIYIAHYYSPANKVTVIDGATDTITTTVTVGTGPLEMAVNETNNKIYTTNYNAGTGTTVSVINGANNTVAATVTTGTAPEGIGYYPANNCVYVSNGAAGNTTISMIDGVANTLIGSVIGGPATVGIAINSTTKKIYEYTSSTMWVVDLTYNHVTATVTPAMLFAGNTNGIAINSTTNKMYMTTAGGNKLSINDASTNSNTNQLTFTGPTHAVAVNSTTNRVYVLYTASSVWYVAVINGATDGVITTINLGSPTAMSYKIAVNEVTDRFYLVKDGTLVVYNGADNTYIGSAIVGAGQTAGTALGVNPVTNKIYVGSYTNTILCYIVDGVTLAVTQINTGGTGNNINGLVVDPATNSFYLASGSRTWKVNAADNTYASYYTVNSYNLAFNPTTNFLYVGTSTMISVINTSTGGLVASIPYTLTYTDHDTVAVSSTTGQAYAVNNNLTYSVINKIPSYTSPGTISNLRIDGGDGVKPKWATVAWNGTAPTNTTIKFRTRGSNMTTPVNMTGDAGTGWTYWNNDVNGTTYNTTSGSAVVTAPTRWLEVEMTLTSTGAATPTLNDFTVTYDTLEAPTNTNISLLKTNNSTLLDSSGNSISAGAGGAWSNQSTLRVAATGLTCASCGTSTNIRPEVEIKAVGSAFDSTTNIYSATAGNAYVDIPNLVAGTGYHLQIRAIDSQARASGWVSYGNNAEGIADVSIDQTTPVGTVTINSGATNTNSATVTLTIAATDSGGSELDSIPQNMQFSNDGTTWSGWEAYSTSKTWTLTAGDGTKTVYVQFRDNAGNISGWVQDSDTDFTAGLTKNGVSISNGAAGLSPNTTWLAGIGSTALAGKYVYYQDITATTWGPSSGCPTGTGGTQPCATGLDSSYPSNAVLISPQAYPSMVFSSYPAQDSCKIIGGRLPNTVEASALYAGRASYGNNFGTGLYWTATESPTVSAYSLNFSNGALGAGGKNSVNSIRCIVDSALPYQSSGTYESSIHNSTTANVTYGNVNYTTSVPGGTSLVVSIRGGNTATPDGTWTAYASIASGGSASALTGKQYLQYKLDLTGGAATPTFSDITFESAATDTINLDTATPTAFDLLSPASGTWQGNASPTLSWNPSTDAGSAISKYMLYVDGVLNRDSISNATTSTTPVAPLTESTHTWYVVAQDGAGNTTNSTSTFTVGYDATVPLAPQSFTITNAINDITLNWSYANNTGAPISFVKVERIDWTNYNPAQPGADWTGYSSYKQNTYPGETISAVYSTADIDPNTVIAQGKQYAYRILARDSVNAGYGAFSPVRSGLTQDSVFDQPITNVGVVPCNGTLNCSTNPGVRHKGFEIKITWNPAVDAGIGTSHYLIYRSTLDLNAGNYQDSTVRNSYQIVGVLPYQAVQQPTWYDNDANNDGITSFVDGSGNAITISPAIQALTSKTLATARLSDYSIYLYRVVGVDAMGNMSPVFVESPTTGSYDVLKAHANGNVGSDQERTPDVTAPTVPTGVNPVATGIDSLNTLPDPTQGILVSWGASTDNSNRAIIYKLYRAPGTISGPGTWGGSPIYTGAATSYQDQGLAQDSYYYYRLTSEDPDANISALSDSSGKKTRNSSVPTTPTFVTVRATTGDPVANTAVGHELSVRFNGSAIHYAANKITGYEVYRSMTNNLTDDQWLTNTTKLAGVSGLNVSGYEGSISYDATRTLPNDTGLVDATTYYYRVRAVGSNSEGVVYSGLSSIQTATLHYGWDTTPDVTAPAATALGMAIRVKDTYPKVDKVRNILTWLVPPTPTRNGISDFGRYEIWRELRDPVGTTTEAKLADITDINTNMYIDEADRIFEDFQFKYYILVYDDAGTNFKYFNDTLINSPYSNKTGKIYSADSIIPTKSHAAITNIAVPSINVSSATVTWTTDQDTDSLVEYRPMKLVNSSWVVDSSNEFITIGHREASSQHSVYIFNLRPNTKYEYRVISRNYPFANETVVDTNLPELVTAGFNITVGPTTLTTTTAEIRWNTNLNASSAFIEYQLQKQPGDAPQGGTAGVEPAALATNAKSHLVVVKGLRSDRAYTYKIKSISTDGFVAETDFLNFRTRAFDTAQFTLAPASSNVAERNITATTAQIVWQTDSPTTSWVDYSTTSGLYDNAAGNNDLIGTHVVVIDGLVPGTKYYYRVRVKDANEVEYTSQEYSFTAVLKPKISNMTVKDVTPYSVTIAWDTNVETETIINWGKTTAYGEKRGKSGTSRVHELKVDNLEDNQEYHYQILAKDAVGNEVADDDKIVRTPLDTEGPKITNVKIDVLPMGESDTTSSVIVSWQTNKPSTTLVEYDEGVIGGSYKSQSVEDLSLNNSHTVIVKELKPATSYHYHLVSSDKRKNKTVSQDYTFVTPSKEKSILQLILKSLEETFAWTRNLNQFFGNVGKRLSGN